MLNHVTANLFLLANQQSLVLWAETTDRRPHQWLDRRRASWIRVSLELHRLQLSVVFCFYNFRTTVTDSTIEIQPKVVVCGRSFCQNWPETTGVAHFRKRSSLHFCWVNASRPSFKPRWCRQLSFVTGMWEEPREEYRTSLDRRPNYRIDSTTGSSCRNRWGTKRRRVADGV